MNDDVLESWREESLIREEPRFAANVGISARDQLNVHRVRLFESEGAISSILGEMLLNRRSYKERYTSTKRRDNK
jgi:hypothetical protein